MEWKEQIENLLKASEESLKELKRKALMVAILRGLFFGLAIVVAYLLFPSDILWLWVIGSILFFLWMMKKQSDLKIQRSEKEALVFVLNRELNPNNSDFIYRPEEKWANHPLAQDLDLFGNHSLFQSIHKTYSEGSASLLASKLCEHEQSLDKIESEQNDARALASHFEAIYSFLAFSKLASFSGKEAKQLFMWKNQSIARTQKFMMLLGPALIFSTIGLVVFSLVPESIVLLILMLNLTLVLRRNKEIMALQRQLSDVHPALEKLAKQLALWRNKLAETEESKALEEREKALKELARIMAKLDSRLNPFGAILFNGLFLYDLQTLNQLSTWQEKYGAHLEGWLNDLYSWEYRSNRAAYYLKNGGIFPQLDDSAFLISFKKLVHPLMDVNKAVPNSWEMTHKKEIHILTGSNMSGKSTFLRSIGTSLCLAHNGFPVFAERFKFSPLQMVSSIRVSDNLSEEASYFYSEIKRIAQIVQEADKTPKLFFLMDEILRGTNSADKQTGSRAILLRLMEKNANGILATHDLSLTAMEEEFPEAIQNYAFESQEKENDLYFDYTLKKGVCEHLNAVFLMTKMGLIQ